MSRMPEISTLLSNTKTTEIAILFSPIANFKRGGVNDIKNLYALLESKGFSIVDHMMYKWMDYSHISDFRVNHFAMK